MAKRITAKQFHAADGVDDWRVLYHVASAHFRTGSLAKGIAFVDEIGRLAGAAEQYLHVDLRYTGVTATLLTRDIALARQISTAAQKLGLPADPTDVQLINVTIDVGHDICPVTEIDTRVPPHAYTSWFAGWPTVSRCAQRWRAHRGYCVSSSRGTRCALPGSGTSRVLRLRRRVVRRVSSGLPDALIDDLDTARPTRVLDVGCGTGKVAQALATRGSR